MDTWESNMKHPGPESLVRAAKAVKEEYRPSENEQFSFSNSLLSNLEKQQVVTRELLMVIRGKLEPVLVLEAKTSPSDSNDDRHGANTPLAKGIRDRLEMQISLNRILTDIIEEVEL